MSITFKLIIGIVAMLALSACATEENAQTTLSYMHEHYSQSGQIVNDPVPVIAPIYDQKAIDKCVRASVAVNAFVDAMGGNTTSVDPTVYAECRNQAGSQMVPLDRSTSIWNTAANGGRGAWECYYKNDSDFEDIWDVRGCPSAVYNGIEKDLESKSQ